MTKTDNGAARASLLGGLLRRFWANRSGNFAMMFGLAAIPFFAFGGFAVDFSRAMIVKNRLGAAVDATALALGSQVGLSESQWQKSAEAFFQANYPPDEIGTPGKPRIVYTNNNVMIEVDATVETLVLGVIDQPVLTVSASAEVKRASNSLETAIVLDVTGSMDGSRMTALRTAATRLVNILVWDNQAGADQYSRVAMIPYSEGVNAGDWADKMRGPVLGTNTIVQATPFTTDASNNVITKTITSAPTKANPIVITMASHGFNTGDVIYITNVKGMTQLNNKKYTVTRIDSGKFSIGVNGTSGYSTWTSAGTIKKCVYTDCRIVIKTAKAHGYANNDRIYFSGMAGMTTLNSKNYLIADVSGTLAETFTVPVDGAALAAWTSGGSTFCMKNRCEYLYFTDVNNTARTYRINKCATERAGPQAYTEVVTKEGNPHTFVGLNYTSGGATPCPAQAAVPLSDDRAGLVDKITNLQATGTTAGQIGIAWGLYMLSPNFNFWPFPPGDYRVAGEEPNGRPLKFAVIMTDGEFNTQYCDGVKTEQSTSIKGCTPDDDAFEQGAALCTAIKGDSDGNPDNDKVVVYTVGLQVGNSNAIKNFLRTCASSTDHAIFANTGDELIAAFEQIAIQISNLRLSR